MTEFTDDVITSKRFITGNGDYCGRISFYTTNTPNLVTIDEWISITNEQNILKVLNESLRLMPNKTYDTVPHNDLGSITTPITARHEVRTILEVDSNENNLLLKSKYNNTTIQLNAEERLISAGGSGVAGNIILRNKNNDYRILLEGTNGHIVLYNEKQPPEQVISLNAVDASMVVGGNNTPGKIVVRDGASNSSVIIDGESADVILANADCAEDFEISEDDKVDPGTVMSLDNDGKLITSKQQYDKRVAGVISGAGNLKPGLILGRKSGCADKVPLALMGRVNCKVDAEYGPIEVGDLLTTSETPGYAMKASDPSRSFGAVIGKALRSIDTGRGLIPVLISLQ